MYIIKRKNRSLGSDARFIHVNLALRVVIDRKFPLEQGVQPPTPPPLGVGQGNPSDPSGSRSSRLPRQPQIDGLPPSIQSIIMFAGTTCEAPPIRVGDWAGGPSLRRFESRVEQEKEAA